MKFIFLSMLSLLLVSCSVEKSTTTKSCTINGQAVDCDQFNGGDQKTPVKLVANIKTSVNYNDSSFDILENAEKVATDYKNGRTYECEASIAAGQTIHYKISGKELKLTKDGEESVFTLSSFSNTGLIGQWQAVERNVGSTITTIFDFKKNVLEISVECKF